ncbi:MAG: Ig-like domain-containing protein, partial [Phycisphaerae bacterium]
MQARGFKTISVMCIMAFLTTVYISGCCQWFREILETTAPVVSLTVPDNAATGVPINRKIVATFSEAMDPLTITTTTVKMTGPGGTSVKGTVAYDAANNMALFTTASDLAINTPYTATITTGAKDLAGNALASAFVWSFTTGLTQDTTAPIVSLTAPANAATGVAINQKIAATFSEAMDPSTMTTATFTLQQGTTPVSGTVTLVGLVATFTPASNLALNTTYTATITTGARDLAGNALASAFVWSFTAGATSDTTAPIVSLTAPANAATGVPINQRIAATFSEAMDPSTMTTATFTLQQGTTPISGTVTHVGLVATFTPASNLALNTTYTATITTGAKDLAGNELASAFVWSFTTGATSDTTAPTVISTNPADNATDVGINAAVNATFSEAMDSSTITTAHFAVTGPGGTPVTGTVAYNVASNIATFTPASDLALNTLYTATITTEVKDLAGNTLASDFVW